MNRNTFETAKLRARHSWDNVRTRVAVVAGTALALPGMAFAQDATFDPATITAKITTYAGYALVIILALAAAIWGLRAAGLIKKG